jgi:hypothetical protein
LSRTALSVAPCHPHCGLRSSPFQVVGFVRLRLK